MEVVLIKHVLQALPTYTLSALSPPKGTFKLLEKHFSNFFWGSTGDQKKYHWSSWINLCYPTDEGGVGVRSMQEFSEALATKGWWRFRSIQSLWATFVKHKYCTRAHPTSKVWVSGNSHLWKSLTQVRTKAESFMVWQVNFGTCSFWWDNWTGKDPLAAAVPQTTKSTKTWVKHFMVSGKWNLEKF